MGRAGFPATITPEPKSFITTAQRVQDDAVANGTFITDGEVPRDGDADSRVHVHLTSHSCYESAKHRPPPAPERTWAEGKGRVDERLRNPAGQFAPAPFPRSAITCNVGHAKPILPT